MAKTLRRLLDELCTTMRTKGAYSAEVSLVSRGLIDDADQLQFDPRNLATSLANLLNSTGAGAAIRAQTGKVVSILGAGSVYTLTATPAAVTLGTTSPAITLNGKGTYLMVGTAQVNLVGATFASSRVVTLKLRRTNNTAADVTGGAQALPTGITTTVTAPLQTVPILGVYTTTVETDIISLFGDVSVLPSAGSITVDSAKLVAVRIA